MARKPEKLFPVRCWHCDAGCAECDNTGYLYTDAFTAGHESCIRYADYDIIVLNTSGGKDSQTAVRTVLTEMDRQGCDRSRAVLSHQCLGKYEWPGTLDLVKLHASIYGLRLEVSSYQNRDKEQLSLLDYVRARGKWPSSSQRYCTSDYKRGPGGRVLTQLAREIVTDRPINILNCFGFRAEESPARAKRLPLCNNARHSTKRRHVWDYLPIHHWSEEQVWEDIHASGVPYHPVYDQGMDRLSCTFCIFAPRNALLTAAWLRPDILQEYVNLETEIGHTFQHKKPIRLIQEAMLAGERPKKEKESWNM